MSKTDSNSCTAPSPKITEVVLSISEIEEVPSASTFTREIAPENRCYTFNLQNELVFYSSSGVDVAKFIHIPDVVGKIDKIVTTTTQIVTEYDCKVKDYFCAFCQCGSDDLGVGGVCCSKCTFAVCYSCCFNVISQNYKRGCGVCKTATQIVRDSHFKTLVERKTILQDDDIVYYDINQIEKFYKEVEIRTEFLRFNQLLDTLNDESLEIIGCIKENVVQYLCSNTEYYIKPVYCKNVSEITSIDFDDDFDLVYFLEGQYYTKTISLKNDKTFGYRVARVLEDDILDTRFFTLMRDWFLRPAFANSITNEILDQIYKEGNEAFLSAMMLSHEEISDLDYRNILEENELASLLDVESVTFTDDDDDCTLVIIEDNTRVVL